MRACVSEGDRQRGWVSVEGLTFQYLQRILFGCFRWPRPVELSGVWHLCVPHQREGGVRGIRG